MEKIKKLQIQLSAAIFLLVCLIIFGTFFSSGFKNFAFALAPNYSKILPASLDLSEWNNLDEDFVAKTGSTMTGILDMGGNRITNVATPTLGSPASDVANKTYVDAQIAAILGSGAGGVYVNWGRSDCPDSSAPLYSGVGFSANYASDGGSSNIVCMDDLGSSGGAYSSVNADMMYPMVTGGSASLPTEINERRAVKCAVCRRSGTCYESYGNWGCNSGSGFSILYNGYVLGANSNSTSNRNSTERACVNSNFDNSTDAGAFDGALWYASRVANDFGLGFTTNAFIRCSICCN